MSTTRTPKQPGTRHPAGPRDEAARSSAAAGPRKKEAPPAPGAPIGASGLLALQRTVGNRQAQALLQRKAGPPGKGAPRPGVENRTGIPDGLKAAVEGMSGQDLSSVRVHTNSRAPGQLRALAYAEGNEIHLGPGQERHLPHEVWHVVQQREGRVKPTMQTKGVAINDDRSLEREADAMGDRAAKLSRSLAPVSGAPLQARLATPAELGLSWMKPVVQRQAAIANRAADIQAITASRAIVVQAQGLNAGGAMATQAAVAEHDQALNVGGHDPARQVTWASLLGDYDRALANQNRYQVRDNAALAKTKNKKKIAQLRATPDAGPLRP